MRVTAITGPTSGIGRAAALELARAGSCVVLLARSVAKAESVRAEIARTTGDDRRAEVIACDLASFESVRAAAATLSERHRHLDVLVNNAGVYAVRRELTVDGHELTWQVDHLSHFLLANLLRPMLAAAPSPRVVVVSSGAHVAAWRGIRYDDPDLMRGWGPFPAYAQAKLAEIMFALAAARRWAGERLAVNAVHPGHVETDLYPVRASAAERVLMSIARGNPPAAGADPVVWLATSPEMEGVTGGYYHRRRAARPSRAARDAAAQEMLWQLSAEATGLDPV
jgi:NAD(P)-dependent dehydrogenase (short-subunit alcohol dehydrogenase family)